MELLLYKRSNKKTLIKNKDILKIILIKKAPKGALFIF